MFCGSIQSNRILFISSMGRFGPLLIENSTDFVLEISFIDYVFLSLVNAFFFFRSDGKGVASYFSNLFAFALASRSETMTSRL